MRRILLSLALSLFTGVVAFGQYADYQSADVTSTWEYKAAKTAYYGGLTAAVAGAAVWLGGNAVCVIEQNRYINNYPASGSAESVYNLNRKAKQQPAYKRGEAMEIGGFVCMLAGAGVAWNGRNRMVKLKNASGRTVATIDYAPAPGGLALALRF